MGKRRLARELILQALYEIDLRKVDAEEALAHVLGQEDSDIEILNNKGPKYIKDEDLKIFVSEIVKGTKERFSHIDKIISGYARNWRIERIARVDLNILRLAIYEILYRGDIPNTVSIDEAVELGKKYGTDDSSKFINGILGGLVQSGKCKEP
ncbi:MAG: transcription antitermination factor NusB [Firmicutes bacterium]|nr:transcription antitermination factor NusB [Bacillota bacterium]